MRRGYSAVGKSTGRTHRVEITRRKLRLAAAGAVAGLGLCAGMAPAASYTWNLDTAGPSSWNASSSWSPSSAYPNGVADVAYLTKNIANNNAINLNAAITLGSLYVADASNGYTVQSGAGGSLTFDNGTNNALVSLAAATVAYNTTSGYQHAISTDVLLASDLWVAHAGYQAGNTTATISELTFSGTLRPAASGAAVKSFVNSSLGTTQNGATAAQKITVNADVQDSGSYRMALKSFAASSSTGAGAPGTGGSLINLTSTSNTYSGGTTVALGIIRGMQASGTPFGTGDITVQSGILNLQPTGTSAVSVAGAGGSVDTKFTYGGGAWLYLQKGSAPSLAFTVGNAAAASNSVLARQNRGTLTVWYSGTLGTDEKVIVNSGVAQANPIDGARAIVSPAIVARGSTAVADYLVYDSSNGLKSASALYTARGSTFTPVDGEISDVSGSPTVNTGNPYAVRMGSNLTINGTLSVGSTATAGQAGILMNTAGTLSGGTVQFNSNEAMIYAGANSTINSLVAGTGGLTKFGPASLTLSNTANTISGGIQVNQALLIVTGGPGSLGSSSNTITLLPQTTLSLSDAGLNGKTIPQNIIVNGTRPMPNAVTRTTEPAIIGGGTSLATAPLLSGQISSGTAVDTGGAAGVIIGDTGTASPGANGWLRLGGDNSGLTGSVLIRGTSVVAEHNNAFGPAGDNTSATGITMSPSPNFGMIGVRAGITISGEYLRACYGTPNTNYATLCALPDTSGNNGTAVWTGGVGIYAGTTFGAVAGNTLRIEGTIDDTQFIGGIIIGNSSSGPTGTVEITSANLNANQNAGASLASVYSGTLRLSNSGAASSATGYSPIQVSSGAGLEGTGSAFGTVKVLSGGYLRPGNGSGAAGVGTLSITGGGVAALQTWVTNMASGSVVADAGSHVQMDITSVAADRLALTAANTATTATLAAPIEFSVDPAFAPATSTAFDLVTARTITYQSGSVQDASGFLSLAADNLDEQLAAISPNFTRVTGTPQNPYEYSYQLIQNDTGGTDVLRVTFAAVPEPASAGLLAAGGLVLLARRNRRAMQMPRE